MATVQQVLVDRLAAYQVELTEAQLDALVVDSGLDDDAEYTKENAVAAKTAMASLLAELLARPDVTEGGYSVKWDRGAIAGYLSQLRTGLGLTTAGTPTITDASNRW